MVISTIGSLGDTKAEPNPGEWTTPALGSNDHAAGPESPAEPSVEGGWEDADPGGDLCRERVHLFLDAVSGVDRPL